MKEHREIPYTLLLTNLLISLLPAPQLDVKRTIWRALKFRNKKQENSGNGVFNRNMVFTFDKFLLTLL